MDEKELRNQLHLRDKELVNSPDGAIEIFSVVNDTVRFGYLATGKMDAMSSREFIDNFAKYNVANSRPMGERVATQTLQVNSNQQKRNNG